MSDSRPTRLYKVSDSAMLNGSLLVLEAFSAHKPDFLEVRGDFADPFHDDIKKRITDGMKVNLANTSNQGPKASSPDLKLAFTGAKEQVAKLKNTLEAKYKAEPAKKAKYLSALGLDLHYADFYAEKSSGATELHQKMNTALAGPLKAELLAEGFAAPLFDKALTLLAPITGLNLSQEVEKQAGKGITDENITEFNAIYQIAIGICDQGKALFASNPATLDKFVWDKVVRFL
jgi:hypothetical protein